MQVHVDVFGMRERLTEADIRRFVERFYAQVAGHPVLGPVFAARIEPGQWPAHLDRMCGFWSTVLLGTRRYLGNPMLAHRAVAEIRAGHFAVWLDLFAETLRETLDSTTAAAIEQRARRMGARLVAALGSRRDDPPDR